MKFLVIQKGEKIKGGSLLARLTSFLMIWSALILIILMDIYAHLYQAIYFTLQDIPKIKRSDYITFDRWDLSKLSLGQKISCIYCGYANGISAWFKAVVNQTEIHSCAIKHKYNKNGQEHHKEFNEYKEYL